MVGTRAWIRVRMPVAVPFPEKKCYTYSTVSFNFRQESTTNSWFKLVAI